MSDRSRQGHAPTANTSGHHARFGNCQSGSIKTLTALLIVPLFACVGYAIDYTRVTSVRSQMQAAADAAALAARVTGGGTQQTAKAAAEAFAKANAKDMLQVELKTVKATPTDDGFKVELTAEVPTPFASVIGIPKMNIAVASESIYGSGDMEVALVLDVTGSMADTMGDLKQGAKDLAEALYGTSSSSSKLKMAVVPYAGAVNIGNGAEQMGWMDVNGDSQLSGKGLSWHWAGYEPGCVYTPGGGGGDGPGSGTFGWLSDPLKNFAGAVNSLVGIPEAHAATAADVPAGYNFYPDCHFYNPKVNFFDLFNQLGVAWKGCVMTRDVWNDRDVSDEAPTVADAETLFVPWFWPDTTDQTAIDAKGYSWDTVNDYVPDRLDLRDDAAPKFNDAWLGWGGRNLFKFPAGAGVVLVDETGPDTLGPNKGCPDPLLPLTETKSSVIDRIDTLSHWNGSGTNTAEGIAWGMRVLSPGAPFTQGSDDPEVKKVMVVMTDGVNNLNPSLDDSIGSEWSTYSHIWDGRISPPTYQGFRDHINARMLKACEIAKAQDIEIYTVSFGVDDEPTKDLLRQCASKPPYAYNATTANELVDAFRAIGKTLSDLRLSK